MDDVPLVRQILALREKSREHRLVHLDLLFPVIFRHLSPHLWFGSSARRRQLSSGKLAASTITVFKWFLRAQRTTHARCSFVGAIRNRNSSRFSLSSWNSSPSASPQSRPTLASSSSE